jgi:hypothetical protein
LKLFARNQAKDPRSTGILNVKENFKATYFGNPRKIPAIVVIPDLEVPGMRAIV